MKKLILMESHFSTIVNALNGMYDICVKSANEQDITTAGN